MKAVSATAHALDGLYGTLVRLDPPIVPSATVDTWVEKKTKRTARILETLKLGFGVGAEATDWIKEFAWLFKLRDAAVTMPQRRGRRSPIRACPSSAA